MRFVHEPELIFDLFLFGERFKNTLFRFGGAKSLMSYEEILFCVRQNLVPSFVRQLLPQLWRDMVLLDFGSYSERSRMAEPF